LSASINTSYASQAFELDNTSNNRLVLDLGASEHFTPNKDWLLDFKKLNNNITMANKAKVSLLDKDNIPILYKG